MNKNDFIASTKYSFKTKTARIDHYFCSYRNIAFDRKSLYSVYLTANAVSCLCSISY